MGDNNCNKAPLRDDEVKEVVDTWIDILKIPTVSGAYIREDGNFINVGTKWSVDDAAKKDRVSFARNISVLKSSIGTGNPVISSSGSVTVDEKLSVASKSGQKRAVIVEKSLTGDPNLKTEFLQIWSESTLLKTYNLTELDLHKSVYSSAGLGATMTWSQSENKLAYMAEKKIPKAKSFYTSATASKARIDEKEKKADVGEIGEEYVYRQSWGEQLTGLFFSEIIVLDILTDEFSVVPLPEEHFPTDINWIGDSHIVGTTYPLPVWRLGLIYCSNRESRIFSVNLTGANLLLLTGAGKACRSARVRPDGGYIVWQERTLDGAHDRARAVHGVALNQGQPSGQPQLLYSSSPQTGMPIYEDLPRNCWSSNGSTLFATTPNEGNMICLAITLGPPVQVKKIEQVDSLLIVTNEYLLVTSSTTITSPTLRLLSIAKDFQPTTITQSTHPIEFQTMKQYVSGEASPPAIFYGPAVDAVPPNSVPLVVWPHGGPHSTFVDTFLHEAVFFMKLGFAILKLNYVGSTGGSKDTADDLMGRIGDRDVKDCQLIVTKLLNSVPTLDPSQVVVFGGSHGGFLACHLSSAYPDMYKAAVMRNPVTDLTSLVGTSDITDWTYAEAGVPFPESPIQTLIPTTRNLQDAQKYLAASPIHNVDKVKGASLLLLGSEDLRVPAQQGLDYYRALKAHGKIAEVRMYPDSHPLSKAPVRLDTIIHSALWFKRYLR